jgi:hypothetical protein
MVAHTDKDDRDTIHWMWSLASESSSYGDSRAGHLNCRMVPVLVAGCCGFSRRALHFLHPAGKS